MKITLGSVLFFKPEHREDFGGDVCVTVSSISKNKLGSIHYDYFTSRGTAGSFTEAGAKIIFDLSRPPEGGFAVDEAAPQYREVKQLSGPNNWIYIVPADEEQEFKQLVAALDKATAKRWAGIRDQFEAKYGHLRTGKYNPKLYIKTDQT